MKIDEPLTILIGSFARGTPEAASDVDIVRVGHNRALSRSTVELLANPESPTSYIDYDRKTFNSLFESGSLFIHHVLTEGKLIEGNPHYWSALVKGFSVTKDLSTEIQEHLSLCKWLSRPEVFVHAVFPQLSHTFRALKNAAIFMLAQNGVYVYDKRRALQAAFNFLTKDDIELLLIANNAYERGFSRTCLTPSQFSDVIPGLSARINLGLEELSLNGTKRHSDRN